MIAGLTVRTRHLVIACVAFAVAVLLQEPLDGGLMLYMDSSFAALFALLYTVGRRTDGWTTALLCVVLYGATSLALSLSEDEALPAELLWGLGLCAPPVLAGRALRGHRRVRDDLEAAQRSLAEVEVTRAARAVEDERTRIAGELQTVLANDVSAIVVQAEAVHRVLAVGERDYAADSLRVIEDTGREALGEMRRLLGVLRHDVTGPSLAPQPGVSEIAGLARRGSGDTPAVTVEVAGAPVPVSPGIDLAAFWIAERAVESAAGAGAQRRATSRRATSAAASCCGDRRPARRHTRATSTCALVAAIRAARICTAARSTPGAPAIGACSTSAPAARRRGGSVIAELRRSGSAAPRATCCSSRCCSRSPRPRRSRPHDVPRALVMLGFGSRRLRPARAAPCADRRRHAVARHRCDRPRS